MAGYEDIIRLCASGDNGGYMAFYNMFSTGVYNSSIRILRTPQDAEEVMQETLLKVMRNPKLYRSNRAEMERFLRRVAINHSIDIYRKRKLQFIDFDSVSEKSKAMPDEEEHFDQDRVLTPEMVKKAMAAIAEGYRLVLNLHLLEEMDYRDIARVLKMKESAVRSQYSRGRKRLAEKIKEIYGYE